LSEEGFTRGKQTVPDPNDQFDFEDLKSPEGMSLEPLPEIESLGEAIPAAEAASAEEAPAPQAAEELPAPPPVEEGKKRKKKAKKKEKIEEKEEVPRDSAEEESVSREGKKPFSELLHRLSKTSPYTVLLGATVVFLLIAVFCMFIELSRYHFDYQAKDAKERVSLHVSWDPSEIQRRNV
jgi:hypothetical protein